MYERAGIARGISLCSSIENTCNYSMEVFGKVLNLLNKHENPCKKRCQICAAHILSFAYTFIHVSTYDKLSIMLSKRAADQIRNFIKNHAAVDSEN